jgi:hypothetical protein
MSSFGRIGWQLINVPAHGFELPTEAVDAAVVILYREQLIYKSSNDIGAKRKSRRPVVLLLPLEPSALEKWLMTENVRRRPNLTEKPLRCIQGASFRCQQSLRGYS